jgi:hypothetical protein
MNKLLRPALLAFSAVLTIVLVSCSGSDGKDGKPGAEGPSGTWSGCTAELSADGSEAVVVCGGEPIGRLTQGEVGPDGEIGPTPFCTMSPKADGKAYTVTCVGKPSFEIKNGEDNGGEGNCALKDDDEVLTISCDNATKNFRLSLCGSSDASLGQPKQTFNETTHFCSKDFVPAGSVPPKAGLGTDERVVPKCGTAKAAYDVGKSYCARSLIIELSRTAGKTLVAVEDSDGDEGYPSDELKYAFYSDIDPKTPTSANWKVQLIGQCFAGTGAASDCEDMGAETVLAGLNSNVVEIVTDSDGSPVLVNGVEQERALQASPGVPGCGFGKFFDITKGICIAPDAATPGDLECATIMKNANTCYSGAVPAAQAASAQIKTCSPKIGGTATRTWYDANNVLSCDESRTSLPLALRCDTTKAKGGLRIVSEFQLGAGRDGATFEKKVSCYVVKDPTVCDANMSEYVASGELAGTCGLLAAAKAPVCPGDYVLNDKNYYRKACEDYIKDAYVLGYPDGTADGNSANVTAPVKAPPYLYKIVTASGITAATFIANFGRACVMDTVVTGTGNNARGMVYDCEGTYSSASSAFDPGLWSVAHPSTADLAPWGSENNATIWKAYKGAYNPPKGMNRSGATVMDKAVAICKAIQAEYVKARRTDSKCVLDVKSEYCGAVGATVSADSDKRGLCVPVATRSVPTINSGYSGISYKLNGAGTAFEASATADMCSPGSVVNNDGCALSTAYATPTCPAGYNKDTRNGDFCYQAVTSASNCPPGYSYNSSLAKCTRGSDPQVDPVCSYSGKLSDDKARCVIYFSESGNTLTYCPKGSTLTPDGKVCKIDETEPKCIAPTSPHFDALSGEVKFKNGKCTGSIGPGTGEETVTTLNGSGGAYCYSSNLTSTDVTAPVTVGKDATPETTFNCKRTLAADQIELDGVCYDFPDGETAIYDDTYSVDGGCLDSDNVNAANTALVAASTRADEMPDGFCQGDNFDDDGDPDDPSGWTLDNVPCYLDFDEATDVVSSGTCYFGVEKLATPVLPSISGSKPAWVTALGNCLTDKTIGTLKNVESITTAGVGGVLCDYETNKYNGYVGYELDGKVCAPTGGATATQATLCPVPKSALGYTASDASTYFSEADEVLSVVTGDLTYTGKPDYDAPDFQGIGTDTELLAKLKASETSLSVNACWFDNNPYYCPSNANLNKDGTIASGGSHGYSEFGKWDWKGSTPLTNQADMSSCALVSSYATPTAGGGTGCASGSLANDDTGKCEAL